MVHHRARTINPEPLRSLVGQGFGHAYRRCGRPQGLVVDAQMAEGVHDGLQPCCSDQSKSWCAFEDSVIAIRVGTQGE
jgi:hypothetical protein